MYRYLTLILPVIFCLYQCKGARSNPVEPKAIGLGLITVNTSYPLPLFKQGTDRIPFDTVKFELKKSGVTRFISKVKLGAYLMTVGDSYEAGQENINRGLVRFGPVLKFRVLDTTASSYTIVTNEQTWETMVIKKDPSNAYYTSERELDDNNCINCPGSKYNPKWSIYETWERYLRRVEYITSEKLVIYDKPNGKVIFENKENTFLPFGVEAVQGEWIKLKKGFGRESNFDGGKNYAGWIKWRDGARILIDIVEHTYE